MRVGLSLFMAYFEKRLHRHEPHELDFKEHGNHLKASKRKAQDNLTFLLSIEEASFKAWRERQARRGWKDDLQAPPPSSQKRDLPSRVGASMETFKRA